MGITFLNSNTVVLVLIMLVSNFSMSISGNIKVGCIERERQALTVFKQSLTDPSNRLSSWVGQDCCSWRGVVCSNVTGHVVKLNISNDNPNYDEADYKITSLIGKGVSLSLAELKHLTLLDLSFNNFSSSKIPSFFGNFKSLRHLDLSDASFAGVVPPSLGNLSNLEYLDISYNNFSSSKIPCFFGNFKSLRTLVLSEASFAGVVPHSLGNLSNLQGLGLGSTELLKIDDWNWLSQLSSLQFLDLQSVDLSQVSDHSRVLNSFPYLSYLSLSECNLVEFPLSSLSYNNLTNIEVLSLAENSFSGSIPSSFFINMPNLKRLSLASNHLNGSIPESMGQLSNLETLNLRNNLLSGTVSEIHFDKLSSLTAMGMSSNFLAMNVSTHWIPPFQLEYLNLGSWEFVNGFPLWFETQKRLTGIHMANAKISGPHNFDGILPFLPSTVEQLDLSNCSISGSIPQNIGDVMPNLFTLLLSHNNISGRIPTSLCGVRSLGLLDFADNHLSGDLPDSCWSNLINMSVLDLSSNHLTGSIPSSIGNWSFLISLHLRNNKFFGVLPMAMESCKSLIVLDLANNGFSGKLPTWIKKLLDLQVLNLRLNKFDGFLVHELCALSKLHTLNLAHNNFTGTIPFCFGNFSGMTLDNNTTTTNFRFDGYFDNLYQVIKGRELEYIDAQDILVNLDLSSNNLEGHIPEELTFLSGLHHFNLSRNKLTGLIPEKIGNLESLESLDFSQNHITGMIPQSISEIYFLEVLNLSYNNLSGRIPTGNQLQTLLDLSIYAGNQGLCGIQIEKECAEDESFEFSDNNGKASKEYKTFWFYNGLVVGIVIGFSGVCGVFFSTRT